MRTEWNIYRTRFLVRARQLSEEVFFTDALGREHKGKPGDYLVETSDGDRRVTPRQIFEDIYVAMNQTTAATTVMNVDKPFRPSSERVASMNDRPSPRSFAV